VEVLGFGQQAHADCGHTVPNTLGLVPRGRRYRGQSVTNGDEGPINGSRTRATVCFQDIAIDPEGALAQLFQVNDGAQAASDESLNLDTAAIDSPATITRLARGRA